MRAKGNHQHSQAVRDLHPVACTAVINDIPVAMNLPDSQGEIIRVFGACFESFCGLIAHRGIEIQFTDLAGVQWCRNSDRDLCNHGFLVELPHPDRWERMVGMMKNHTRDGLQPIKHESQHSNLGGPDHISDQRDSEHDTCQSEQCPARAAQPSSDGDQNKHRPDQPWHNP